MGARKNALWLDYTELETAVFALEKKVEEIKASGTNDDDQLEIDYLENAVQSFRQIIKAAHESKKYGPNGWPAVMIYVQGYDDRV